VLRAPELDMGLQGGLTRAEQRGRITSLDLLATLLLMQPRLRLAFWAVSTHCWVTSSLPNTVDKKRQKYTGKAPGNMREFCNILGMGCAADKGH